MAGVWNRQDRTIRGAARQFAAAALVACAAVTGAQSQSSYTFANFETPAIHPVDLSTGSQLLAVCNVPDGRLELFDVSSGIPQGAGSVGVGLDPVSVRFRTPSEAWVVNGISDSVSVVDVSGRRVMRTLPTKDDPSDVVFAGAPPRAFVSCAMANVIQVFDPATGALLQEIPIDGDRPRALEVSADGNRVYVAVYESGNATTLIAGATTSGILAVDFPRNNVSDPDSPYGGQNPPPNFGSSFKPPMRAGLPPPPISAMIVRKNAEGRWMDDNNGDWTSFVSGDKAPRTGRPVGWDMPDRDLAIIDTQTLAVSYRSGLMNICMGLAANPVSGRVAVIGTDARNEIRFEPNLKGNFLRVNLALVDPDAPAFKEIVDLNPHLDYTSATLPHSERVKSVGDPRGIVWNSAGTRAYVTGMGSDNLVVVDASGTRTGTGSPIPLGEGPTGLALDETRSRLYVLNRFENSISVVDTSSEAEVARVPFFDPTPARVRTGRKHFYNTHLNSGTGHLSCASCHIDGKLDRLAWDLGDPSGTMKAVSATAHNLGGNHPLLREGFEDFHPMKGPMITQTLQDIIGHEPHHWRGDRNGIEEFNGTFVDLLGHETGLTSASMQEFEDYLASIIMPPNPNRNFDNTLKWKLPLPDHYTTGRFAPAGQPLPDGNPQRGMALFTGTSPKLDNFAFSCVQCHAFPTGSGPDHRLNNLQQLEAIPVGPHGEHHEMLVSVDGQSNVAMKVPQLRNMAQRVGCDFTHTTSRAGFGFHNDGGVDSLARFVGDPRFKVSSDQDIADLVAFMLSFSGSDLPSGSTLEMPPGRPSADVAAAVGRQITLTGGTPDSIVTGMETLAHSPNGRVDLVVKGVANGMKRGWFYDRTQGRFVSDYDGQSLTPGALKALSGPGAEQTWTVVPRGLGRRLGIDRDGDGIGDRTELDSGSDGADQVSRPLRLRLAFDVLSAGVNDDPGTTVTLLSKSGISNLEPLRDVAGTVWKVDTARTGWSQATVTLTWTDADVAGFSAGDLSSLTVFAASSPSGPWTALPTQSNPAGKSVTANTGTLSWLAIGKSTVPVALSRFSVN